MDLPLVWSGFLAKDLDYLVDLVLLVLQLKCLGVNLVVLAPQLEDLKVDLVENVGNLLLPVILLSLSLLL